MTFLTFSSSSEVLDGQFHNNIFMITSVDADMQVPAIATRGDELAPRRAIPSTANNTGSVDEEMLGCVDEFD